MLRRFFTIVCLAMLTLPAGCGKVVTDDKHAEAGFLRIFNGTDLAGWEASGGAKWVVKDGAIVGTQGDNYAHGDLFTKNSYEDFLLTVTYRVEWPCNTGVWFSYQ